MLARQLRLHPADRPADVVAASVNLAPDREDGILGEQLGPLIPAAIIKQLAVDRHEPIDGLIVVHGPTVARLVAVGQ